MNDKCPNFESSDGHECDHYREELYSVGFSRYCRFFEKDVYHLKNVGCPHRPIYSDDKPISNQNTSREK